MNAFLPWPKCTVTAVSLFCFVHVPLLEVNISVDPGSLLRGLQDTRSVSA